MHQLGQELRRERQRQSLTIEQLAERAGLTPRTVGSIERDPEVEPRAKTLTALADALNLNPALRVRLMRAAREARRTAMASAPAPFAPHRVADFTGRADEIAQLEHAFRSEKAVRAVVISGTAGVGKTSLAVRATRDLSAHTPSLFVDLDGHGPSPLTPLQILQTLLRQASPDTRLPAGVDKAMEAWKLWSETQKPVVVLDSARDEEQVRDVLDATSAGVIIITSRRRMSELVGLASIRVGALPIDDSITFLREAVPAGQRDEESLAALADIIGCIPLALRIAANRIASRPHETAARFLERVRSEERRMRTMVAGDLSVEATFSVSYSDLSAPLASLFRALGVLSGTTFDERIAAAATGGDPDATAEQLDQLVELGLLEIRGTRRYHLHDLLRLFASERLTDEDGRARRAVLQNQLHEWLLSSLERAGAWFEPDRDETAHKTGVANFEDAASARDWLVLEADHWWPAYLAAVAGGQHESVIDSADALHWFSDLWMGWGNWTELYAASTASAISLVDPLEEARHLGYLAWAEIVETKDGLRAFRTAQRAFEAAVQANDDEQKGWAQYYQAWAVKKSDFAERAPQAIAQAVRYFTRAGHRESIAQAMFLAAAIEADRGDDNATLTAYEGLLDSVIADRQTEDSSVMIFSQLAIMDSIAQQLRALGRYPESLATARHALELAESADQKPGMALALKNEALALSDLGRLDEARSVAQAAFDVLRGDESYYANQTRDFLSTVGQAAD